jgi:hypothetical protein
VKFDDDFVPESSPVGRHGSVVRVMERQTPGQEGEILVLKPTSIRQKIIFFPHP